MSISPAKNRIDSACMAKEHFGVSSILGTSAPKPVQA